MPGPTDTNWSATPPGQNTGDAHIAAEAVGANLTLMDAAWWGPSVSVFQEMTVQEFYSQRELYLEFT